MKPEILVIATHPDILKTILRLLNNHDNWSGTGVATIAEAIEIFPTKDFNVVLLGAGLSEAEEQQLRTSFSALKPGIPCIAHYGGGSGLLYAEVLQALAQ